MYGNTSVLIMGEAKRRKNLGIPPREKAEHIGLPQLDKKAIQQKVRSTLYKYPIIPFSFLWSCNIDPNRRFILCFEILQYSLIKRIINFDIYDFLASSIKKT